MKSSIVHYLVVSDGDSWQVVREVWEDGRRVSAVVEGERDDEAVADEWAEQLNLREWGL